MIIHIQFIFFTIYRYFLLSVFFLFVLIFQLFSQTRDPYLWPFATESVWNMPLHRDAWKEGNHEDAGIDVVGAPSRFKAEGVQIFTEDTADPLQEYHRVKWTNRCTDHYHYNDNYVHFPDDYIWDGEDNGQKNSEFVLIKQDSSTIWDGTLFTRCTEASWVGGAWFAPDRPYSIYGSGAGKVISSPDQTEDIWGHGASKMSGLGGTIRKGELTSPEDQPIRHALKFTVNAARYLASCEVFGGKPFKWPAQGADGYACDGTNRYQGSNIDFVMGSLLALPPELTKEELDITTLAGRKIFDALQTYGGYPVEDAAWDCWQFFLEEDAIPTDWPTGNHSIITSGQFFNELRSMISNLHIIKVNDPDHIAGGPTSDHENRMATVACQPGIFGSGETCPLDPVVRISSPLTGSSHPAGEDITITAEASDGDGEIDHVNFYIDDQFVSTDNSAPYSFVWNEAKKGHYRLRAEATDNSGATTSSMEISVWLGNKPPVVEFVKPDSDGVFFRGEDIILQAEASDSDGSVSKVLFLVNDQELVSDPLFPYAYIWKPDTGLFDLKAMVIDNENDSVSTDPLRVGVFPVYTIGNQQIPNADFSTPEMIWHFTPLPDPDGILTITTDGTDGMLKAHSNAETPDENWGFFMGGRDFFRALEGNATYELEVDLKGDSPQSVNIRVDADKKTVLSQNMDITGTFQHFRQVFQSGDRGQAFIFFRPEDPGNAVCLDNISLIRGAKPEIELILEDTLYVGLDAGIQATASDPDGSVASVEFFIHSKSVSVDATAPYSCNYTPAEEDEGRLEIKAVARDNQDLVRETTKKVAVVPGKTGIHPGHTTKPDITVYPNPSPGKLIIQNNGLKTMMNISLLDITGKIVWSMTPTEAKIIETNLPASLHQGIYFLRIRTDETILTRKIMISE